MGKYDNLKNLSLTCEERLGAFGNQMMEELVIIQGYAQFLLYGLTEDEISALPDDFQKRVAIIKQAADNLAELREVLIMQRK